ncbi:MAG: hypothetical protein ACRC62_35740 [Microcoleus sp.]
MLLNRSDADLDCTAKIQVGAQPVTFATNTTEYYVRSIASDSYSRLG